MVEVNRMTTPANRSGSLPVLARDAVWSLDDTVTAVAEVGLNPGTVR